MRKTHLFIVAVTLIAVSCKKQLSELNSVNAPVPEVQVNNISNPCYGNTWTMHDDYIGPLGINLVYNNKLYVFYKSTLGVQKEVHIYDGTSWEIKTTNLPDLYYDSPGSFTYAFTIGNKGYIGNNTNEELYEYNFATNGWAQKANFPGTPRTGVAAFSIGNKGYIVGGSHYQNGTYYNHTDTWEYSPASNAWMQKANMPLLLGKVHGEGFTIGNKGYVVNGRINFPGFSVYPKDLLEYDPATDDWNLKAPFPGDGRLWTMSFVISGMAYVGGGMTQSNVHLRDFYKYNPTNNTWTRIPDLPDTFYQYYSFSINSRGYVGTVNGGAHSMEKYTPRTCPPIVGPNP